METCACLTFEHVTRLIDSVHGINIFGYGSLIWRPDTLSGLQAAHGYVRGFVRRFWQASPDHRGTPQTMGRVVTLVRAQPESLTHGTVFSIPPSRAPEILDKLFVREAAGYCCLQLDVVCEDGVTRKAVTFFATPDNKYWSGPQQWLPRGVRRRADSSASGRCASGSCSDEELEFCSGDALCGGASMSRSPHSVQSLASVVARSRGSSGANLEYLARLRNAMAARGVVDAHLESLWAAVQRVVSEEQRGSWGDTVDLGGDDSEAESVTTTTSTITTCQPEGACVDAGALADTSV